MKLNFAFLKIKLQLTNPHSLRIFQNKLKFGFLETKDVEFKEPIGDIELLLIIQVILSIHKVLPLGLRLVTRRRIMSR